MKTDRHAESLGADTRAKHPGIASTGDWADSARVRSLCDHLEGAGPCVVGRAPGRLDVLGGLSGGFGASVIFIPTRECVLVAMRERSDGKIFITDVTSASAASHEPAVVDSAALLNGAGPCVLSLKRMGLFDHDTNGVVRGVLGTLAEAVRSRLIGGLAGGFSFVVHAGGRALACLARHSAITAAVLRVLTGSMDSTVEASTVNALAQRVELEWHGVQGCVGDFNCAWFGSAGTFAQLRSETESACFAIPSGVECLALHCNAQRRDFVEKWDYAQTAARMGRTIICRIVDAEGGAPKEWNGTLARLGIDPYVKRFRDRVPTKIRGQEFKAQFATAANTESCIQDATTYKVRSRTEHHIYEQVRCEQFTQFAQSENESRAGKSLRDMGELMYGSHWSCGQRCGLGSIGADALVKSIRGVGASCDIYGARVSGGGCGGVVTVMMSDHLQAHSALADVIAQFTARTGNVVTPLRGSIPGAAVDGFRRL